MTSPQYDIEPYALRVYSISPANALAFFGYTNETAKVKLLETSPDQIGDVYGVEPLKERILTLSC